MGFCVSWKLPMSSRNRFEKLDAENSFSSQRECDAQRHRPETAVRLLVVFDEVFGNGR